MRKFGTLSSPGVRAALYYARKRRLARIAASANPYEGYYAHWKVDAGEGEGYDLTSSRISSIYDLSGNGRTLANATSGDRPVIGAMVDASEAALFTSSGTEFLTIADAELGGLFNTADASVHIDIAFELEGVGLNQTLVNFFKTGSTSPNVLIGMATSDKIRIQRRTNSGLIKTLDITTPILVADTTYELSATFTEGLVTVYLDGIAIMVDTDYIGTTTDLDCNAFGIGARILNTAALPLNGRIQEVKIRSV
jgi:hypothetical protein